MVVKVNKERDDRDIKINSTLVEKSHDLFVQFICPYHRNSTKE